jgi:2-keto-4-pentenoate hydratase/2-oxohepta-3-ene-1,7-dioic acid hydratase in catechol pathway
LTLKEKITLEVNGARRQDAELDLMLYKPVQIVSFLSKRMTLEEGDLVFTGTPAGVGKVVPGDVITGAIEGIASLRAEVI